MSKYIKTGIIKARTDIRRTDIRDMMLEGKSTSHICAWILINYGQKRRTVERDIAYIYKELRQDFIVEKQELIQKHIMRYEMLYCFYMDKGTEEIPNVHFNPELASKMLEKKEKLLQLYNPNVQVTYNQQNIINYDVINNFLSNITVDQIKEILNEKTN